MTVAKQKVAEALGVAEAQIQGGAVTIPANLVREAHEAAKRAEALSVLTKAVKADKTKFKGLFAKIPADIHEMRDAQGRVCARRTFGNPVKLHEATLRENFPREAEACTFAQPWESVEFKA